jgi:hypothetical protein
MCAPRGQAIDGRDAACKGFGASTMKILATLRRKAAISGSTYSEAGQIGESSWTIFPIIVNWVTTRNYGFSDAADLFILISGYTVAFVFARLMMTNYRISMNHRFFAS